MRFLFYRYNSICEPDMIESLKILGHSVDTIENEMAEKKLEGTQMVQLFQERFAQEQYDGVFSVNYYPIISEICRIYQICYFSWTVDAPIMELLSDTIGNKTNRIFCFDYAQYEEIHKYNPECIFYLPLATNVERWDQVIASASVEERKKYAHEVAFVGSLYTEKCPYDEMKNPSEYLSGYLLGIMEAQKSIYGASILEQSLTDEVVKEFVQATPTFYIPPEKARRDDAWVMANRYLGMKVTSMERVEIMQRLGKSQEVSIYTGSCTDGLPVKNLGFAKTLTQMPLIFHESKINLNITCRSIKTGIPQRIWDIMGAGGFVLTNYQAELGNYFEIGKEIEVFGSIEELIEKCDYYLVHEKERETIAKNGYELVQKKHTYVERIRSMLELW